MAKQTITLLPRVEKRLTQLGENLRLARLRRRLAAAQLAERAGITAPTLRKVERGDPSVSLGALVRVMFCLGLDADLELLGRDDELGRKLQDADLHVAKRAPRRPSKS